jgi:hypothetical protein
MRMGARAAENTISSSTLKATPGPPPNPWPPRATAKMPPRIFGVKSTTAVAITNPMAALMSHCGHTGNSCRG